MPLTHNGVFVIVLSDLEIIAGASLSCYVTRSGARLQKCVALSVKTSL